MVGGGPEPAIIGIVQGHYDINRPVNFTTDVLAEGKVSINTGIAVVVPFQQIIDLLMQEEFVEKRNAILEESKKHGSIPSPDTH